MVSRNDDEYSQKGTFYNVITDRKLSSLNTPGLIGFASLASVTQSQSCDLQNCQLVRSGELDFR